MKPQILIVEDDLMITKMLVFLLTDAGFETATLGDPRAVTAFLADHAVDLMLLDVMLPHIDGFTLLPDIRRAHPDLPVIFLTARGTVRDKVDGFGHGADDYISKPFEPTELLARVQTVLQRYHRFDRTKTGTVITVGEMTLDLNELAFSAPHRPPVRLTPIEMKVLDCLMRNAKAVISRETLIKRAWNDDYEGIANRVDVTIRRLRRKIEQDPEHPVLIHTVRGSGYVFRAPQREREQEAADRLPA